MRVGAEETSKELTEQPRHVAVTASVHEPAVCIAVRTKSPGSVLGRIGGGLAKFRSRVAGQCLEAEEEEVVVRFRA
jgi:hypothetical protein